MIDDEQRPRYWRHTLFLAVGMTAVIVFCAIVLPLFAVELNDTTLLGFPLGYYIASQGIMIGLIVAVYWTGSRQARTDRKFGATEDM